MNTKTIKSKLDKIAVNEYNDDTILRFSDRLQILDDEVAQVVQYLKEKGIIIRDIQFNNFNSGSTNEPEMSVKIYLEEILNDDDYHMQASLSKEIRNRWKNAHPAFHSNYVEVATYIISF